MEDQIAISRLKQGDLNCLEILVSRYQVQAVRAAYLILCDRSLAEDVVQTAFVKVALRVHQFDDERPFGPWFFRIVVNDSLKLTRKQKRSVSLDEHLDDSTVQLSKWLADPDPNPEQLVEQMETRQVILKAIKSLPPGPLISIAEAESQVGFALADFPNIPAGFEYLGTRLYGNTASIEYQAQGGGGHLIIMQSRDGYYQSDWDNVPAEAVVPVKIGDLDGEFAQGTFVVYPGRLLQHGTLMPLSCACAG